VQDDVTLCFKLGDCIMEHVVTFVSTYVSAGPDSVMLHLYLRRYFYN